MFNNFTGHSFFNFTSDGLLSIALTAATELAFSRSVQSRI